MKHPYVMGSTLLELLIILVITALLVQLAVPQYQFFIQKAQARGRLADLLSLQTELESCHFSQRDYRVCAQALISPSSGELEKDVEQFAYQLAVVAWREDVVCYRFETNSEHEMAVFDRTGERQDEHCV